jgi:3-dehydroquinate synthase
MARNRPILHGHAIAAGLICELYLSYKVCDLPVDLLRQVTNFVKTCYPPFVFCCDEYETIYERMTHDKKNEDNRIRFTLMGDIGDVRINLEINKMLVIESFDFYRENYG